MRPIWRKRFGFTVFVLISLAVLTVGCSQPPAAEPTSTRVDYTGELATGYADALEIPEQLALGALKLEDTDDAVTEAQAVELLPLWQMLQGTALKGETERLAMAKQIESVMTESQVAAISAMALTTEDEQAWLQEQGAAGGFTGGGPAVAARNTSSGMPAGGQAGAPGAGMSEEDRASMRAQSGQQGAGAGGAMGVRGGVTSATMRAVVSLLVDRSGQAAEITRPEGSAAQRPGARGGAAMDDTAAEDAAAKDAVEEADVDPTAMPEPTATLEPVVDDATGEEEVADVSEEQTPTATAEPDEVVVEDAAVVEDTASDDGVTLVQVASVETPSATAEAVAVASAPAAALVQVPDGNPGPPFSVEISLNRAEPSPLLDGVTIYKVTGLLRNEGDQVYAVNRVNFTFYDADGFRGAFYRFEKRRYGEWIEHGALEADFDCMLLAPGEACPFTAEIAAYNMSSFYVHADAVVAEWREPAPVEAQNTNLVDQGSNVRISGTIVNPNTYAIKNAVVTGVLLDANGHVTSIGSAYYVQSIAPGASVAFNALVPADAYVTYQVYVQAEGDFR